MRFQDNMRVRVIVAPLVGQEGIVRRLRIGDDCAWVEMDSDLPDDLRSFPKDDRHGRGRHICLAPEECEEVLAVSGSSK